MKNEEKAPQALTAADVDRIIEMGWEDRTPFEAIEAQFGLAEKDVIALMRKTMKLSSFKMWRKRMAGRSTKHLALRADGMDGFKSNQQRAISMNKISKR
ncbi:TIGR03643 family protein [Hymenobacter sp. HDW8]|uniref:TIGR03643 family protein n=1 Tax=Hymenobacter sp. HDW8 TaxID=2714932 RepID=UPI00140BCD60|nr:TIGR03643 family protein [Hymenobacter sp. HDW8]QIL74933.1 TIGR03643 family protein [Hymenobacter sp. HDW8]